MNANTDKTAQRANTIAFMTPEQADIYLAECKAWDAQMEELAAATRKVETVTITVPSRKLFAPATTETVTVETVKVADLKQGDQVICTGKDGDWAYRLPCGPAIRSSANRWSPEDLYFVPIGQGTLKYASETYLRVL